MSYYERAIMFGDDNEVKKAALVKPAILEGTSDAISTLTKYAVVGSFVFVAGYLFLPRKTARSLKEKYL